MRVLLISTLLLVPSIYLMDKFVRYLQSSPPPTMTTKTPVYYLAHGGPNVMYATDHPAYPVLQQIGKDISTKVKPNAIVVVSAHWQADYRDRIEVNTAENTDLIYDFYGFPSHYYKEKFRHRGSKEVASKVLDLLAAHGIKGQPVSRGPDHGVWAAFKIMFPDGLDIPMVQMSLYAQEDPHKHYALGLAISDLRSQGIVIITGGMPVHNLRDLYYTDPTKPLPYTRSFDEALREAAESDPSEREEKMAKIMSRKDARQAHPTFEHLLPIYIAAGAGAEEQGKRTWTFLENCLSWSQYRFGNVPLAA